MQEGSQDDVTCLVVDDAEHDAEGQGIETLGKVEMYSSEGQCRDDDCRPGTGSAPQHLAFDGFAEEEFLGNGTYDGQDQHSHDAA